ncbi:hypothetical protein HYV72_01470 [Candidatus Uhrbacteria bacterium]|nr:hypothetical protein [Candidatus Uhrbacteria bacterium]
MDDQKQQPQGETAAPMIEGAVPVEVGSREVGKEARGGGGGARRRPPSRKPREPREFEQRADVQMAIQKAYHQAKRNVVEVPLVNGTFPHREEASFGAADVLLMPAPSGTGLKVGGAVRMILELAGVNDAVGKILRGKNKLNVAKATLLAIDGMCIPHGAVTDKEKRATSRRSSREEAVRKVKKA